MTREAATDAKRFAMIAAATALLAVVFRLGLGSRWFSFYGLATLVTLALPAVAVVLHMRATEQKRWRWPIWMLFAATLSLALAQIGFWLFFFHGGATGLEFGIGRAMSRDVLDVPIASAATMLTFGWLAVLIRLYVFSPNDRANER